MCDTGDHSSWGSRINGKRVGIIVGYIVAIPFGMIDLHSVASAKMFQVPQIMHFGIEFEPTSCIAKEHHRINDMIWNPVFTK